MSPWIDWENVFFGCQNFEILIFSDVLDIVWSFVIHSGDLGVLGFVILVFWFSQMVGLTLLM